MKILSFSHYSGPLIGGHRPYNLDKALSKEGVEVRNINNWAVLKLRPSARKVFTKEQRAREKVLDEFVERKDAGSYFMVHGPFFPEKFYKKLAKTGIPIILDFRDDPILQAEMLGVDVDRKKATGNINAALEYSQLVMFPSDTLKSYYPEAADKSITVMNAGDPEHFDFSPLPGNNNVVSLMTAAPCYMYDTLLEACLLARKNMKDLSLHLRKLPEKNAGNYQDFYNDIKGRYDYDWVRFFDSKPYSEIAGFLKQFQMSAITLKKGKYADAASPLKLFDFMALGRPVVATNCAEIGKLVKETGCGLTFDFTPEDMAGKMTELLENPSLAQKMGENGRRAIEEKHSWRHRARTIIEALE